MSIVIVNFSIIAIFVEHARPCSNLFSPISSPSCFVCTFYVLSKTRSTIMMLSFTLLAVALLLMAVLACENPATHSCASVFTASTALVTSFCATYTASNIAATNAIPSAIYSACSGKSQTISAACTCFVTPTTTPISAAVSTSVTLLF